jgi:hypothetical protein
MPLVTKRHNLENFLECFYSLKSQIFLISNVHFSKYLLCMCMGRWMVIQFIIQRIFFVEKYDNCIFKHILYSTDRHVVCYVSFFQRPIHAASNEFRCSIFARVSFKKNYFDARTLGEEITFNH